MAGTPARRRAGWRASTCSSSSAPSGTSRMMVRQPRLEVVRELRRHAVVAAHQVGQRLVVLERHSQYGLRSAFSVRARSWRCQHGVRHLHRELMGDCPPRSSGKRLRATSDASSLGVAGHDADADARRVPSLALAGLAELRRRRRVVHRQRAERARRREPRFGGARSGAHGAGALEAGTFGVSVRFLHAEEVTPGR